MNRGQASLEALLVFAIFLALLAVGIAAAEKINEKSGEANKKTNAIAQSKECASIVDAVYSNSGGKPKTLIHNCVPSGAHQIRVNQFPFEKTAFTIAETIELVQNGEETYLEVATPDHYH